MTNPTAQPAASSSSSAMRVILLVEDNPAHAELVKRGLEHSAVCATVHLAEDGEQALDYLFQRGRHVGAPRPNVVLLDINLPKINGLDVLKAIKTTQSVKHIPVVMLTTSDAENDVVRAYQHSANSFCVKPVDFAKFVRLMDTLAPYWLNWNHNVHTVA
jgi:two-component system response regulator